MSDESCWCPFTPAGSMLAHLEARTKKQAWRNLLQERPHGLTTRAELEARGFTVERLEALRPQHLKGLP